MNILEAKQLLLGYFLTKDTLSIDGFSSVVQQKNIKDETEAVLRAALLELDSLKIITKSFSNIENKQQEIWVLNKPLLSYEQSIQIDGNLAIKISSYVNNFLKTTGDTSIISNPLNISRDDIIILLDIIDLYAHSNVNDRKKK